MPRFNAPDPADALALAEKLRTGGWRYDVHVSMRDGGVYRYRSELDRRVECHRFVAKRGGGRQVFVFGDPAVDVAVRPGGPIVERADTRHFPTLEALAAAVLVHDQALAEEREWQRAAPLPLLERMAG